MGSHVGLRDQTRVIKTKALLLYCLSNLCSFFLFLEWELEYLLCLPRNFEENKHWIFRCFGDYKTIYKCREYYSTKGTCKQVNIYILWNNIQFTQKYVQINQSIYVKSLQLWFHNFHFYIIYFSPHLFLSPFSLSLPTQPFLCCWYCNRGHIHIWL